VGGLDVASNFWPKWLVSLLSAGLTRPSAAGADGGEATVSSSAAPRPYRKPAFETEGWRDEDEDKDAVFMLMLLNMEGTWYW